MKTKDGMISGDIMVHEDLKIANMVKHHHLAKFIETVILDTSSRYAGKTVLSSLCPFEVSQCPMETFCLVRE